MMAKLLALAAYVYQSILAFGLLMVMARFLAAADYAAYSIFLGLTQLAAIAGFDWLRFACSRFYPGLDAESEKTQRLTLLVEALGCAVLCLAVGGGGILFGVSPALALIGGAVAAAQGSSDLHLSVVRFRQRFSTFSTLNVVRATALAACTIVGGVAERSVTGATTGLLAGYVAYGAFAVFMERGSYASGGSASRATMRAHLSYGGVSAGMSVLGMLSPLGLKVILTASLGPAPAAGVLLALDLLQRPFVMVVSALQAVEYPDVVASFDRGDPALPTRLGRFYGLLITLSLVGAAALLVVIRPVAEIVVAPELRDAFLVTAPGVILFSVLRALTQNMSTTPAHLNLNLRDLAAVALVDCASFNSLAFLGSRLWPGDPLAIAAGATLGAVLAGIYGLTILRKLPFRLPVSPIAVGTLAALVAATLYFEMATYSLQSVALAVTAAGAIGMAALIALYSSTRGGRVGLLPLS